MAEVMAFSDLKELGSEANVKAVGPSVLHAPATARLLKQMLRLRASTDKKGSCMRTLGTANPTSQTMLSRSSCAGPRRGRDFLQVQSWQGQVRQRS